MQNVVSSTGTISEPFGAACLGRKNSFSMLISNRAHSCGYFSSHPSPFLGQRLEEFIGGLVYMVVHVTRYTALGVEEDP